MAGDRLIAELLADLGILQRRVVAAIAAPIAPQPMPYRAWFRHISGPSVPSLPAAGLRRHMHILKGSLLVTEARSDHCHEPRCAEARPVRLHQESAHRLLRPLATLAQIIATSAIVPEVIHIFSPLIIYSSPDLRAAGRHSAGVGPKARLGQPKAAQLLPAASSGSHLFFCSSEPKV